MKRFLLLLFPIGLFILYSCKNPEPVEIIESPAGIASSLPYLTTDDAGNLYLSWVEPEAGTQSTVLKYAQYSGSEWSEDRVIANGRDWFVNWADFPSIIPSANGIAAAHWLHKIPGNTYSYEIKMAIGSGTNKKHLTPHFDKTSTEHGFLSMAPLNQGDILAVWLDGRQTVNRAEDEYSDITKAMSLRSAVVTRSGKVTEKHLVDDSVCDCCQTSLARTDYGAVAAYRNRTDDEIRDIYVSRYKNGSWSESVAVHADNWEIGGCPVNGPVIKSNGQMIFVAWFTGAGEHYQVKAAYSFDGGKTFENPVRIDKGNPIGRVDAAFVGQNKIAVSWMEKSGNTANLNVRFVDTASNITSPPTLVSPMAPDRKSGFPQLEVLNNKLYFAWTSLGDETQIKMASLTLPSVFEK